MEAVVSLALLTAVVLLGLDNAQGAPSRSGMNLSPQQNIDDKFESEIKSKDAAICADVDCTFSIAQKECPRKCAGDPQICKAVHCGHRNADTFCPIKCASGDEEAICLDVDCSYPIAKKYCPIKCAEDPELCEAVDCSRPDSQRFCPNKCANDEDEAICDDVDCSYPIAKKFCPNKCDDDPEICEAVDCNLQNSETFCPIKCTSGIASELSDRDSCEQGKCVHKEDCPQYKLLKHVPKAHPDFQKLTSKWESLTCDSPHEKICCPETQGSLLPKPGECGKKYLEVSRISGGTNAELGEFPWAALLGYKVDGSKDYEYRCGGTLINARYVLTAAHCNAGRDGISVVVLGEMQIGVDPDCPNYTQDPKLCQPKRQVIEVERVIMHENFKNDRFRYRLTGDIDINDIALIKLKEEAILNIAVQPICLPFNEEETAYHIGADNLKEGIVGRNVTAIGWGSNSPWTKEFSSILQKVRLPILATQDCKSHLSQLTQQGVDLNIGPKDICAGVSYFTKDKDKNKDSCPGDSGGGMFINEPWWAHNLTDIYYITHYQIGIVSYGYQYCGIGYPGVYTRVTEFIPWIIRNMESDIPTKSATAISTKTTTISSKDFMVQTTDKINQATCSYENVTGGRTVCTAGQRCSNDGMCQEVCTDDTINEATCLCENSTNEGVACNAGQRCSGDGVCQKVCSDDAVNEDTCFCYNSTSGGVVCNPGQRCSSHGVCQSGQ